ncbi:MAG: hypothetical protein RL591_1571 [Planctomycetota bacterium]
MAFLGSLVLVSVANAEVGINEVTGHFAFPTNPTSLALSGVGALSNPRLDGFDFGTIDTAQGQSLILENWNLENYAFVGGASPPFSGNSNQNFISISTHTAKLSVRIYMGNSLVRSNLYSMEMTGASGNARDWALISADRFIDLTAGLALGDYTVQFNTPFQYGTWASPQATTSWYPGPIHTASFSVIPAPGGIAFMSVVGLVGRRRRR